MRYQVLLEEHVTYTIEVDAEEGEDDIAIEKAFETLEASRTVKAARTKLYGPHDTVIAESQVGFVEFFELTPMEEIVR